jgi:DNA-binding transcriptional MerR regulator
MSKLSISEAAKIKGVSTSTLRRWELEGKLFPERTAVEVTKIGKLLKN